MFRKFFSWFMFYLNLWFLSQNIMQMPVRSNLLACGSTWKPLKIVGSFLPEVYGCKQRGVPIKRISTRKPIEIVTEYDGKEGLVIAYFGRYTEKQLMNSYLIWNLNRTVRSCKIFVQGFKKVFPTPVCFQLGNQRVLQYLTYPGGRICFMIAIVFPKRTPFSRVVLVSRKKITYEVNHILKCVS